jgi:diguanylate cyclase (GGDEF)-like protein
MRFSFGSDSNSSDKILKQAEKYVQQGKFAAAVDEYHKLLDLNPNDLNLLNTIGDLYVRDGRGSDAARYFMRVADRYEHDGAVQSSIAVYKKILKADPTNIDVELKLAALFTKQGLISDARRQYSSIIESYRRSGNTQQALRIQQKLADLDPENVALRLDLARAYKAAKHDREAYQAFVQAGQELQRANRLVESVDAFREALALRPDSRLAANALADAYVHQGRLDESFALLNRLLGDAPADPDLNSILAKTYLTAGRVEDAEATYLRLFDLDKTRTDGLLDVGRHYVEAGRFDRAVTLLDRCIDQLLARGQKKRATALLKEILKRDRSNLAALERLADIYTRVDEGRNLVTTLNTLVEAAMAQGRRDKAQTALKKLVEVEPHVHLHQQRLDTIDAPKAAAAAPSAHIFPDGFESTPLLMEWTRSLSEDGTPPPATGDESPVPRSAAPASTSGEYSMELLDEMVSQHPEFRAARIKLLEELIVGQPKYVEGRAKLKQLYVDDGQTDKAAAECIEIARLYEAQGETEKAKAALAEAYDLKPSVTSLSAQVVGAQPAPSAPAAPAPVEDSFNIEEMFTLHEFHKYFDREWRRAIRDGKPLSLLRVEIDAFNDYVDTYGLLSGDYCLERVAAALEGDLLRPGDVVSNLGGGTFLVLLPETPEPASPIVAERLRARVENLRIRHEGSRASEWVTISVGSTTAIPHPKYSSDILIAAADNALLRAKVEGGNRVVALPSVTE